MGCDGGTIPRRDELVKTKEKPEQKDKDAERLYRWRHCAVSQSALKHPIVACELGRLYNKEDLLSRFIEQVSEPAMIHIRGLKDIRELRLTPNPAFRESASRGDEYVDSQTAEYICPVTSQEMNGKSNFVCIWSCGCVLSEKALKEIKTERCLICNKNFDMEDAIPLNPPDEMQEQLKQKMKERRAKAKAAKKEKKEGKRNAEQNGETEQEKKKKKNLYPAAGPSSSKSNTSVVKSVVSNVLKTEEFNKIRSSGFSVASDPNKSDVFKSIFDTHKSAQGKVKGHWVTCNPQYF